MRRNSLVSLAVVACGLALTTWIPAAADDKGKPPLSGVWALSGGEMKIEFAGKDTLKLMPHGDTMAISIVCKYTLDKAGVVKAKVEGFDGKEELKKRMRQVVPPGTEFRFKWQAKGDQATLGDVKGDKAETLQSHLEGKYEKK